MQNITMATKRRGNEWRGALIIDNEFQDAVIGPSLPEMVANAIGPILVQEFPEGQEIAVTIVIRPTKGSEGTRGQ